MRAVAAMGTLFGAAGATFAAAPAYSNGSLTWIHALFANNNTPTPNVVTRSGASIPSSASETSPPAYQISDVDAASPNAFTRRVVSGLTGKSDARGWVGHVENASTVGVKIGAGSGVSQVDPSNIPFGANYSQLKLGITNIDWTTTTQFGPYAQGYFSLALAANDPAKATFNANLQFFVVNAGVESLLATISFPTATLAARPGPFTDQRIFPAPPLGANGTVPTSRTIRVKGYIDIQCANTFSGVDAYLEQAELSAAPPTASFHEGAITDWNSPATWTSDGNSADPPPPGTIQPTTPNGVGYRARFAGAIGTPAISLSGQNVVIGTLDVDARQTHIASPDEVDGDTTTLTINGNGGTMNFDTLSGAGNAVLQNDHIYGNTTVILAAPVNLLDPLDVINNSTGAVIFSQGVSGNPIRKSGSGPMVINNPNLPSLTIDGGDVSLTGAVSIPTVTLNTGATLRGGGAPGSAVSSTGGIISPGTGTGSPTSVGAMTFQSLSANNGTFLLDIDSGARDQVLVSGGLTLSGISSVNLIDVTGGTIAPGTYNLIQYGSLNGTLANLALSSPTLGDNFAQLSTATPGFLSLVLTPIPVTNSAWIPPGSGTWSGAGNWTAGVPNGINHIANFNPQPIATTVIVDAAKTVGTMNFNGAFGYNVLGSPITMDVGSGGAAINVIGTGSHQITAPLMLNNHLTVTVGAGGTMTLGGAISGGAANTGLTKAGAGVLLLTGASSYNGPVNITAGTVRTSTNGALGALPGGTVTISSGGVLDIGGNLTNNNVNYVAKQFVIAGVGAGSGALINTGTQQLNAFQRVSLSADATIGGTARFDIRGAGGVLDLAGHTLTKTGDMQVSLTGVTVTDGNIVVDQGTLGIETTTTIPVGTGAITMGPNTRLQFFSNTAAISTVQRPIVINGSGVQVGNGSSTTSFVGSNMVLGADITFTNLNSSTGALALAGNISEIGGPRSITKNGATVLALGGTNTYTGATTVNAGALLVNGTHGGGESYTVNSGAFLGGTGTISAPVTVNPTGGVAPGVGSQSIGPLTVSSVIINSGNLQIDVGGGTADSLVSPSLNLSNVSTVTLSNAGGVVSGTFPILQSSNPINGSLGNLSLASTTFAGYSVALQQSTSTSIDLQLSVLAPLTANWNNSGNGNWSLGANWSPAVPNGVGHSAILGGAITSPAVVTLDGNMTVSDLTFNNSNSYTLAGPFTLGLDAFTGNASISVNTGFHTISAPILISDQTSLFPQAGCQLTISGVISGGVTNSGLNKSGIGTVILTGANTFTGPVNIMQGVLRAGNNAALGSLTSGPVTISPGGALDIGSNLTLNNANFGAKQFVIFGNGPDGSGAIVNTGTIQQNAFQQVALSGDASIGGTQRWDIRGGTPVLDLAGHTLTKTGNNQISLVGVSVTDGNITVNQGTLGIETTTEIPIGSGVLTFNANTRLQFFNNSGIVQRTMVFNGSGIQIGQGGNGSATIASNMVLAGDITVTTLNAGTGSLTLAGNISESGGAHSLTKAGSVQLILSGTNSYTGGTIVNAGSLIAGKLSNGTLTVNAGLARITAKPTANDPSGTTVVPGLAIALAGAQLDLTNNSMVIDYTGPVGTLVGDVRQHLAGNRITSTSATSLTKIGYGDNAVLGKSSFAGVSVDPSSVLMKFTYAGDADLNGAVDVADLGALASAWQTSGVWTNGDFDYNNTIDVNDLGLLASNWQQGVGSPLGPGSLEQALAALGLPNVAVPEPSMLGLVVIGAVGLRRRIRR